MLDNQPNHGWQLCFLLLMHASGSDFSLFDGSDLTMFLKGYPLSIGEMVGDALAVVRPTGVCLFDLFCYGIQFYILLSPYLSFIPFLISWFICSRR